MPTPSWQIWSGLDRDHGDTKKHKIMHTLLFVLIYSHYVHMPHFLGSHGTLLCVLITLPLHDLSRHYDTGIQTGIISQSDTVPYEHLANVQNRMMKKFEKTVSLYF